MLLTKSIIQISEFVPNFEYYLKTHQFQCSSIIFDRLLPKYPKICEEWLNRRITSNHASDTKALQDPTEVLFNFDLFERSAPAASKVGKGRFKAAESQGLGQMLQHGQRELLKHPLCESFVYLKWQRLNWAFYLTFIYQLLLAILVTLTAFTVVSRHPLFVVWAPDTKFTFYWLLLAFYVPCLLKFVFLGLYQRSTFWLSSWVQVKRPCPPIPLPSMISVVHLGKYVQNYEFVKNVASFAS